MSDLNIDLLWAGDIVNLNGVSGVDQLLPILHNVDDENSLVIDTIGDDLDNIDFQVPTQKDPTGKIPAKDNFTGRHNFDIKFDGNKGGAAWNYSPVMDKLYIKMDNKIQMAFSYDTQEHKDLYVRALPVFLDSNNFTKPVQRCYSHRNPQDKINQGYTDRTDHIIRIDDPYAIYQHNEESGRFSVVVPLGPKQNGTDTVYKTLSFMCQNSCLGMKRPLAVILTLEDQYGHVLGRRTLNVKVCSGPNRDRKIEESTCQHVTVDKKTKKRKSSCGAEDNTISIKIPNKIAKLVVSYAELRLKELCEEENRKPDDIEKQCLKQYCDILESLRQDKTCKTSS